MRRPATGPSRSSLPPVFCVPLLALALTSTTATFTVLSGSTGATPWLRLWTCVVLASSGGLRLRATPSTWRRLTTSPWALGCGHRRPVLLTAASGLLLVVAVAASLFPAHRAAKADPMVALRNE